MLSFNIKQKIKTIKKRAYKLYNKLFIYLPVDLLIFLRNSINNATISFNAKPSPDKHMIIFRHDGIGDYVLFRNFIEVFKKSPKFVDYKITLLGNSAWKDLAEFLDKDFIDEFIWIDKRKFAKDFFYRYKKFKEITSVKYEILIHPFSRDFFNADNDLAFLIKADKKIGSIIISKFIKPYKKKILEKIYTELIPDIKGVWFEFYKNKNFFERILAEKINIDRPFINLPSINLPSSAPELFENPVPYAAFFIGASVKHRKWPAKNFAEVARYLKTKYGHRIVLCGGKNELDDIAEFKKHFQASFIDTVSKISLVELPYVIKNASLVISNETMAPHIAMALANATETADNYINPTNSNTSNTTTSQNTPIAPTVQTASAATNTIVAPITVSKPAAVVIKPAVIVISTGEASYGHFVPYPKEIGSNYTAVFHPYIEKNLEEYIDITTTFGRGYDDRFNISEITVESVLNKVDKINYSIVLRHD